jgi:hypothetical protein
MALNALKKFWNIRLNAKGEPIPLSGDISSITPDGAVDVQTSASDITLADGKVLIGNASGVAAAQDMGGDVIIDHSGTTTIGAGKVKKTKVAYKSVAVTVLADATSGSSSDDADLVGGEILGIYPTSNQDQLVDSVAIDGNGAITVTLGAAATADNTFKVVVLRNV